MYSMTAVCRLTGLNASTLRTWERRYGVPTPQRNEGNRRRYPPEEVERLAAIARLLSKGHPIASLAHMPLGALQELANQEEGRSQIGTAAEALRDQALDCLTRRDFVAFRARLVEATTLLAPVEAVEDVLAPICRHVGEAWASGDLPIHVEHLATAIIRQIVTVAAGARSTAHQHARLLFTTLAGDRHELGAIFAWYLAQSAGHDCLYLGPDLDAEEILTAAHALDVDVVVLSMTPILADPDQTREAIAKLASGLKEQSALWVGLSPTHPIGLQAAGHGVRRFHDYRSFAAALSTVPPRS